MYVDVVERKPPLLFWTYAGVFEATGSSNWRALHVTALVWTLCTMAGLFVCARRLFDWQTGLLAALLSSVFQPWGTFKNLPLNGEILMNLPLVCDWAITFGGSYSRWRFELFAAGALLCLAFLLKQPAVFAAVPIGLYLLLPSYRISRGAMAREAFVQATILTLGFSAMLVVVVIFLFWSGNLSEAIYWVITNHSDLAPFWTKGLLHTLAFGGACLPLLLGAAFVIKSDYFSRAGKSAERTALLLLVIASAAGAVIGGRFYPHYYIQLIPPLALIAAPCFADSWFRRAEAPHALLDCRITMPWLALTATAFAVLHWSGLSSERAESEAGKFIREHSAPGDRIFVWGHKPKVYLNSYRRPASRYIVTFPLTGSLYAGPHEVDTTTRVSTEAWKELEQDFKEHPPAYIVDLERSSSVERVERFPFLANLLGNEYDCVADAKDGLVYRRRSPTSEHVNEAIQYRTFDRRLWV